MELDKYLSLRRGSCKIIAAGLDVKSVMISQWRYGKKRVPADRCIEIEKLTDGVVRCEEMRPDIDWQYLRATDCPIVGAGGTAKNA